MRSDERSALKTVKRSAPEGRVGNWLAPSEVQGAQGQWLGQPVWLQ